MKNRYFEFSPMPNIKSKAEALTYAIAVTRTADGVHLDKAEQVFRMFVDNIKLPDTETAAADNCFKNLAEAAERLKQRIEEHLSKREAEPSEAQPETASPKTVILPGMPGLEWMTENLSGFGGTEVDGNTYYTWEEAMSAAEQLGNGWRLPTREEFVQLDELGSTWDDERKGRWFGGNHDTDHKDSLFMPAAGYRDASTGALTSVGTEGRVWSSSSYTAGNHYAGYLYFNSGCVNPLSYGSRADAFSVRCVRNVK